MSKHTQNSPILSKHEKYRALVQLGGWNRAGTEYMVPMSFYVSGMPIVQDPTAAFSLSGVSLS
jgi:hypothetical protein